MPIVVRFDVELAQRKGKLKELAEDVGISVTKQSLSTSVARCLPAPFGAQRYTVSTRAKTERQRNGSRRRPRLCLSPQR